MTLFVALVCYIFVVACILRFFRALGLLDRQMRILSAELFPPTSTGQTAGG